jgi:GNAT superfamily N-acetyltransferase
MDAMKREQGLDISVKELEPSLWPDVEKLFGPRGACGGCWCMYWRIEKGEKWTDVKGAKARTRLKKLISSGKTRGVLAYVDGEPVGWCTFGPRPDFSRLDRARSLACEDADRVWSVPCFFIRNDCRRKGVATALLGKAIDVMKRGGVRIVEGYPVRPGKHSSPRSIPDAFAWTGTLSLFEKFGFKIAGNREGSKPRMRLTF